MIYFIWLELWHEVFSPLALTKELFYRVRFMVQALKSSFQTLYLLSMRTRNVYCKSQSNDLIYYGVNSIIVSKLRYYSIHINMYEKKDFFTAPLFH